MYWSGSASLQHAFEEFALQMRHMPLQIKVSMTERKLAEVFSVSRTFMIVQRAASSAREVVHDKHVLLRSCRTVVGPVMEVELQREVLSSKYAVRLLELVMLSAQHLDWQRALKSGVDVITIIA